MKKLLTMLGTFVCVFAMIFAAACAPKDPGTDGPGDDTNPTPETATYKTEYYLEGDDGYALAAEYGETLTGEVGKTVTIERKQIDGYVFESSHPDSVVRGTVTADGSLVLKAYYSMDYTGRVTFSSEYEDNAVDLLKDGTLQLEVKVMVNGEEVTEGVTYASSDPYVSVDEDGMMEGRMRGESDITVSYKNVSETFHATVYDAFIDSEEDWWAVYDHLSYWYKFTDDVTLTDGGQVEHFTVADDPATEDVNEAVNGYEVNHSFTGVIDGGGHTLTWQGSRLFHWLAGATIRNITLDASNGFYWGSVIAFSMEANSLIENVTVNAAFNTAVCMRAPSADLWIKCGGNQSKTGNGGMFGVIYNSTVRNCTLNLDLSGITDRAPDGQPMSFGGIAYQAENGCVIDQCTVICADEAVTKMVEYDVSGTIVTDCEVVRPEMAQYKVEYYLDGAIDSSRTQTLEAEVGETVTVTPAAIAGYAFDEDNENNVLSGTVAADDSLVLKLYYTKSDITFETDTPAAFEMEAGVKQTLEVTVKEGDTVVSEGITYSSEDEAIAKVSATGEVTAVKGGTVTVTVSYAGASKEFEVTVWDGLIAEEADWWAIYENETTLAGRYKLTTDVTLTKVLANNTEDFGENPHTLHHTFTGVIDGDGYTLTYNSGAADGSKLFDAFNGRMENIVLNAGQGFYWGAPLACWMTGATLTDVTLTAVFIRNNSYRFADAFLELDGMGAFGVFVENCTIENCTVNVSFSGDALGAVSYYSGIAYQLTNSTVTNVTVNSTAEIGLYATEAGTNTVTGSKVVVDDGFTLIENEDDFWAIYTDASSLAGSYRLADNLTLTKTYGEMVGNERNETFSGILDGDGHTLTYNAGVDGSRLFYLVTGTIQNITLNAGEGFYLGSAVAFQLTNATIKDVTVTATFNRNDTSQIAGGVTLAAPGSGGLAVWISNSTVENCTINLTLEETATADYYSGIAYDVSGSTFTNVTVKCATQLGLYKSGTAASEENVKFDLLSSEDDGFTLIENEDDFWAIYTDASSLAGSYRLADDLTLTKTYGEMVGNERNETFSGILDGDGHTLTYNAGVDGSRLFYLVTGTIQNITLNAGEGFYLGSAVAFQLTNATIKDVTVTATFNRNDTSQIAGGVTLAAPGSGGLAVWVNRSTVENCTINLTLTGTATADYYGGIAFDITDTNLKDVTVKSATQLSLYKSGTAASETNVNFELITA